MSSQSIFIVEDEIITAKGISKKLKKLGYKIAGIATCGSKALEQIVNVRPDLILMDIVLKKNDIDGIATATRIKETLNIPIIYLTAHSDKETVKRAKITEPFGYILKPYSTKNLQIAIEIALYKHQQEQQLLAREKLLSTILDATQDGVIATNDKNETIYMNSAAQKLTGWQTSEALGQNATEVIQIIDERTNQPIAHPIEQVLQQGKVIYLDEYAALVAKDGSKISIGDSAAPIIKDSNRVEGVVLVFAPRSKSVSVESLSDRYLQNTEAPQAALTPSNSEISVARKKLNEISSDLIDLVVHELRTPITIIIATAESLKRYRQRWTEEKQNNSLNRIQKAIQQITQLLDDVTVWEQAAAGKLFFVPELTDVLSCCEELLSNLRLIDDNNHEFIFTNHGIQERVYLDETLLRYILNNLLLNAIKYSSQDSKVYLLLNCQKNSLTIQVKDEGLGIPDEDKEHIWETFYRASNVKSIIGTGLGLTIVKMCVELHQGEINVETKVGQGTTFTIILPLNSN